MNSIFNAPVKSANEAIQANTNTSNIMEVIFYLAWKYLCNFKIWFIYQFFQIDEPSSNQIDVRDLEDMDLDETPADRVDEEMDVDDNFVRIIFSYLK